jgi:hypothetical protein
MNSSVRIKTSISWLASATIAVAFMCSQAVQANEPTGLADIAAAPPAATESADGVERVPDSPQAEQAMRRHGSAIKTIAKPRRVIRDPRVTREGETQRFSKAAAALWRYSNRSGIGLILGVGF